MTWIDLAVAGAVTATVTAVPGALLAYLLGLRGLAAWAAAFPFGVTAASLAALAAPFVGLSWSIVPVVLVTATLGVVIASVRWVTGRRWRLEWIPEPAGSRWWIVGALVAVAVVVSGQVVYAIGAPDNISQTFDNIFHLNAVRYALDNGNASPLFVGSLTSTSGGMWFYPTAWHAVASLTVQLTGLSIPIAANAMSLVFSALAWPAGVLWLSVQLFDRRVGVIIGSSLAVVGSASFPLLMIDYGVLYPLHMGLAILPASVALALRAFRIIRAEHLPMPLAALGTLGTLPGLAIAHPGALAAWIVLVTVATVFAAVRAARGPRTRRTRIIVVVGVAGYLAVAGVVWWVLRPPAAARTWTTEMTVAQAIGEVALASPYRAPLAALVAALVITGVVAAVRARRTTAIYAVSALVVLGGLYVVVAALPYWAVRDLLTGSWYNNLPRLAAILPLAFVPLAGAGAAELMPHLVRVVEKARLGRATRGVASAAVILVALVAVLLPLRTPLLQAHAGYALNADSPLVSEDEMALLRRLDTDVEPDAVIAGSPWTGTGLAYAISGRRVLQPHTLMDVSADMTTINDELDEAAPGSPVCSAVADTDVRYVLDFGTREVHGDHHPYPGFADLATSPAVQLVDQQGPAKLYRVIGCPR